MPIFKLKYDLKAKADIHWIKADDLCFCLYGIVFFSLIVWLGSIDCLLSSGSSPSDLTRSQQYQFIADKLLIQMITVHERYLVITSKKSTVTVAKQDGTTQDIEVRVWNDTIGMGINQVSCPNESFNMTHINYIDSIL